MRSLSHALSAAQTQTHGYSIEDAWYWEDAECQISGPILEKAERQIARRGITLRSECALSQAAAIACDVVFFSLNLTPDQVKGLLEGYLEVTRKPH